MFITCFQETKFHDTPSMKYTQYITLNNLPLTKQYYMLSMNGIFSVYKYKISYGNLSISEHYFIDGDKTL